MTSRRALAPVMIYLGIDPGSRNCGYGIIEVKENRIVGASYDIIRLTSKQPLSERIVIIHDTIADVISRFRPDKAAVETIFYGKSIRSAFTLGHVRGAIVLAVAKQGLTVYEYSPREVKKGVTGNGNASKQQVQFMLPKLLGLKSTEIPDDAADALAIAFCLYNHDKISGRMPRKQE